MICTPPSKRALLVALLPLTLAAATPAAPLANNGKLVVNNDEWTLSDAGFGNAPDAALFAQNVANWFTGGAPGDFLAYSNNFGLAGNSLALAMTSAGHNWTQSTAGPFTLPGLLSYDAVFLTADTGVDLMVLTAYVQAGGSVYLCAGTSNPAAERANYDPFLQTFGLQFETAYNGLIGNQAISSPHPIFALVSDLYQNNGLSVLGSAGQILVTSGGGEGLYATNDSFGTGVYCTAGTSASGCQAMLSTSGTPSATASSGFDLLATDVEGNKDGLFFMGTNGRQASPWGNGASFQCVAPPVARAGLLTGTGTTGLCDGAFAQDLNARWAAKPPQNPGPGAVVQAQLWYRDPFNTSNQTTSLSNAIEFLVGP
jgi:hypothetical protein